MSDTIFHTFSDGPVMVAPYSHAVEAGEWLLLTGQMPIDANNEIPPDIESQTRTVIDNLRAVMERAGFGDGTIVQMRVYLTRFEAHYERMNAVYVSLFPPGQLPARTCIGVTALARGCEIEIDAVVHRHSPAT